MPAHVHSHFFAFFFPYWPEWGFAGESDETLYILVFVSETKRAYRIIFGKFVALRLVSLHLRWRFGHASIKSHVQVEARSGHGSRPKYLFLYLV